MQQPDTFRVNIEGRMLDELCSGLQALEGEIKAWTAQAARLGGRRPYEKLEGRLRPLLKHLRSAKGDPMGWYDHNVPRQALELAKAGAELRLRQKKEEWRKLQNSGAPGPVLASVDQAIAELEEFAGGFPVDPDPVLWDVLPEELSGDVVEQVHEHPPDEKWDVFVCHASEDKEDFVQGLADALRSAGLRVWYDNFTLRIGDSLRRSIDRGLSKSRFGVVVLSTSFFAKEWPQKELDGLTQRERSGHKVILPIWHDVDQADVAARSPTLADRVAAKSSQGLETVVRSIVEAMSQARSATRP